ncbi:UNVERIFIED_CONTAM: hypothetical protein Slati_1685100 [Sesamum latifolium]|uniref:Retroviral polymerase SH3-like domain-containing protein n=1 Tax=Sesamum latifolium TaxID=2727402 RepID=A0AAW2WUL3_9LAMI
MQVKALEHRGGQTNTFKRRGPVDKKNMICEHCQKIGHNKDTCFKRHGVLDWYRDLTDQRRKPAVGRAYAANELQISMDTNTATGNNLVSDLMEALKLVQGRDLRTKQIVAIGNQIGKLYLLDINSFISIPHNQCSYNSAETSCNVSDVFTLWHKRLGHSSPLGQKGYKLYDLDHKTTLISRGVIFHEHVYPYHQNLSTPPSPDTSIPFPDISFPTAPVSIPSSSVSDSLDTVVLNPPQDSNISSDTLSSVPDPPAAVRKSQIISKPPAWLDDFHCNLSHASALTSNDLSLSHKGFLAALSTIQEPRNYMQTRGSVEWEQVIQQELAALKERNLGCCGVASRTFLAVASGLNWPIHQDDINNSFLHGFLDEDIYMTAPEGSSIPAGKDSTAGLVASWFTSMMYLSTSPFYGLLL